MKVLQWIHKLYWMRCRIEHGKVRGKVIKQPMNLFIRMLNFFSLHTLNVMIEKILKRISWNIPLLLCVDAFEMNLTATKMAWVYFEKKKGLRSHFCNYWHALSTFNAYCVIFRSQPGIRYFFSLFFHLFIIHRETWG